MTNKLPVVGKRYKAKHNNKIFTAVTYLGADLDVSVRMCCNNDLLSDFTYRPKNDNFDKFFEELPEDEAETKPETQSYDSESIKKDQMDKAMQSINDLRVYREGYNKGWNECLEEVKKQMPNHISELSPEVKEAMEELKKADNWFRNNASITLPEHCFKLSNTAFCLLNALDKQFTDKEKLLTDREVLSEKPVNNDKILPSGKKKCQAEPKRIGCNYCGDEIVGDIMTQNGCCSVKCSIGLENKVQEQWDNMPIDENKKKNYWEEDNDFCPFDEALKEIKGKEKFILDSIYYDKQGLPVSIYKKEEEIDQIKMEKLREYFKEKYKSYETQPDENGSFKHIDGIEEETQDLMKESMKPNKETLKSFSDYEKGVGLTKYDSVEELFDDLEGKNS
jgi:hypothetical protein